MNLTFRYGNKYISYFDLVILFLKRSFNLKNSDSQLKTWLIKLPLNEEKVNQCWWLKEF